MTFLSGDVHCAAVGVLKTLTKGKNHTDVPPPQDYRYMLNVVTSACCLQFFFFGCRCRIADSLNVLFRCDREHAVSIERDLWFLRTKRAQLRLVHLDRRMGY